MPKVWKYGRNYKSRPFECPPALQTWALSRIPTNANFFPLSSAFANLDYLYWRLPKEAKIIEYPWILWYIWKARNDKLFNNSDQSPQMVVNLAIDEANAWVKAQLSDQDSNSGPDLVSPNPVLQFGATSICSVDGSWKSPDNFSGLGWCYLENSQAVLFGSRNIYKSLSPLHAELEALIWAMECMQLHGHTSVIFLTDSMELKQMIQSPQAWPAFLPLLDRVEEFKHSFTSLRMEWWPRSSNKVADGLAKGARRLNSSFNYINCNVPAWFSEPI